MIRKYMKTFINEEMTDDEYDEYERRREKGDIDTDPDSDEDDEYRDKVKSLSIFYMSRENMLSLKNNPRLYEDDFSVRVDLNFLADYDGNTLSISDIDGDILRNPSDIMSSLDISAPKNMEDKKDGITAMLRQKVVSETIVEYIDSLKINENVAKDDELTAYVVMNDK
jgi:hypothetical protein